MLAALEVDHVAGLGKEHALFFWVVDFSQSLEIVTDVIHSHHNTIHRSKLVEQKLLGFLLLGCQS